MSMPTITTSPNPISMSQAITDLIESIALEETALSHILNAEGEKLQKVLAMEDVSLNQILDVNETVMNMVTTVNELEHTLRDKLESSPTTFITLPGKAAEACRTGLLPSPGGVQKRKGRVPDRDALLSVLPVSTAQIRFAHLVVIGQFMRVAGHDDGTCLQDIGRFAISSAILAFCSTSRIVTPD